MLARRSGLAVGSCSYVFFLDSFLWIDSSALACGDRLRSRRMNFYRFGPYFLSKDSALLRRDGESIPLTNRRYEILLLLVERAGAVVTKDEIIDKIWRGQIIDESNLTQLIYATRRLLGDTVRDQNYIETIPGVGYRFRCSVEELTVEEDSERSPVAAPDGISPGRGWVRVFGLFARTRESSSLMAVLIALSAIVTPLLLATTLLPEEPSRSTTAGLQPVTATHPSISPVIRLPGTEESPSISSDGRYLAFSWDEDAGNNPNIYYIDLNDESTAKARRVTTHPNIESSPTWGPNNREIAFLRIPEIAEERYHLIVASVETGEEREVGRVWGGLDWSPDGQFFAVSESDQPGQSTGIFLLSSDGAIRRPLSNPNPELNCYDSTAVFSPDGKSVAFVRWTNDHVGDLHTVSVSTGVTQQLTFDKRSIVSIDWHPRGEEIIFTSNRGGSQQLWRISAAGGSPKLVANAPYDIGSFEISPQNLQIFYSSQLLDIDIEVRDLPDTTGPSRQSCTINSPGADHSPNFSPDQRKVLFESNRAGSSEIWLANADCTAPTAITSFQDPTVGSSGWSPKGDKIIFNRGFDGKPQIFSIRTDRSDLRQLTLNSSNNIVPAFSFDSKWIYFSSDRLGRYDIWRISDSGSNPYRVTSEGGMYPRTSPDGKSLLYTRNELLRQIDLSSGSDLPISELSRVKVKRHWSVVGDNIYYAPIKSNRPSAIFRFNLKTRTTKELFQVDGVLAEMVPGISVSSDERRIAYSFINYRNSDLMVFNGLD